MEFSPEALQSVFHELREQNGTLRAELEQMRTRQEEMATAFSQAIQDMAQPTPPAVPIALPAAPVAAPPLPPSREAKGADPKAFSGDRRMTDSFLHAVKLNIALQPRMYSSEVGRILYTLSWMRGGTAGAWAENLSTVMLDPAVPNPYATFAEFLVAFENAFGEPDRAFSARTQLHALRQGTMSAEEYTAHFEAIAGRTGFDEQALIDAYQRGLSGRLLEKIHYSDLPVGLAAWKEKARKLDNLYRRLQQTTTQPARTMSTLSRPIASPGHSAQNHSPPAAPATSAPAIPSATKPSWGPMDVDATRPKDTRKCFNCGQEGHLSHRCPQPRRQQVIRATDDLRTLVREEIRSQLKAASTPLTPEPSEGALGPERKDF